jgi:hypothetical protein
MVNLRAQLTFKLQYSRDWRFTDLANNNIALDPIPEETPPEYINQLRERLSRTRLVTDIDAVVVGALRFCVPLSNESPSSTG